MTPLHCLRVTRRVPYAPFVGGDATYSARLIESIAMAGAQVTVLCHSDGGPAPRAVAGVEWVVVPFRDRGQARSLVSRLPVNMYRFATPQIRRAFDDLVRERSWDVVLIDNLAMAGVLRRGRRPWPRALIPLLVYVSHNHEEGVRAQLAASVSRVSLKRLALRWDAAKTAPIERGLVDVADLVTMITDYDADLFRRHGPAQRYLVLTPGYDGSGVGSRTIDTGTPRRITLVGSYAWFAKQLNLWRFLEVGAGPLARAGIGIDIVGWIPDDFANRLRAAFPDVIVTGPVDRVEPYLAQARMGVVAEEVGGASSSRSWTTSTIASPSHRSQGRSRGLPWWPERASSSSQISVGWSKVSSEQSTTSRGSTQSRRRHLRRVMAGSHGPTADLRWPTC